MQHKCTRGGFEDKDEDEDEDDDDDDEEGGCESEAEAGSEGRIFWVRISSTTEVSFTENAGASRNALNTNNQINGSQFYKNAIEISYWVMSCNPYQYIKFVF